MNRHSYSLDAFRVLAIFGVFFCHLNFYNGGLEEGLTLLDSVLANIGGLAAHFFIVLSAFLAAYFYDRGMSKGYWSYVKKRMRRLLPVNIVTLPFYVVITTYVGFYALSFGKTIVDVLLSTFLLQELLKFSAQLFNTPAWTISTLFILYLITPALMWPIRKLKNPWVLVALVVVLTWSDVEYREWLTAVKPDNWWLNYASPVNRILSFVLGLALGHAARVIICPQQLRRYTTYIELAVFGIFFYGCAMIQKDYAVCHYVVTYSTPLIIALCFMEGGVITRLISACGISKASPYVYAFYMCHFFFILLAYAVCNQMLGIWGHLTLAQGYAMAVATFLVACGASVLLHHFVEKRF